jgi:hypothetical protein
MARSTPFPAESCVAALLLTACSAASPYEVEADARADPDDEVRRCAEERACPSAGLGVEYPIAAAASIVEVSGDAAVLIGDDGMPLEYAGCGLDLDAALETGREVQLEHYRPAQSPSCWVTRISREGRPLAGVARCASEEPQVAVLGELGWSARLSAACEGIVDHVCSAGGVPRRIEVPVTVSDLVVTAAEGGTGTVQLGEIATVGSFRVRLLAAHQRAAVEDRDCPVLASGSLLVTAASASGAGP